MALREQVILSLGVWMLSRTEQWWSKLSSGDVPTVEAGCLSPNRWLPHSCYWILQVTWQSFSFIDLGSKQPWKLFNKKKKKKGFGWSELQAYGSVEEIWDIRIDSCLRRVCALAPVLGSWPLLIMAVHSGEPACRAFACSSPRLWVSRWNLRPMKGEGNCQDHRVPGLFWTQALI